MLKILKEILAMLQEFFKSHKSIELPEPEPRHFRNERLLVWASKEIGVKEIPGPKEHPRIRFYHKYAELNNDKEMSEDIPWCASFICAALEVGAGMGSTNSRLAKSFLKWGVSTKSDPRPGDLVIYDRGGWKGHVGIWLKEKNGYTYTLGGNQSNAVTIAKYSKRPLDIRRSSKHRPITAAELSRLKQMAEDIIAQKPVSLEGSMA